MDEFENGISDQMNLRIKEQPELEDFIAFFLGNLQFYCSQENWITQAQIGMQAETTLHSSHEEVLERLTEIVFEGLSNYCHFETKEIGPLLSKSSTYR